MLLLGPSDCRQRLPCAVQLFCTHSSSCCCGVLGMRWPLSPPHSCWKGHQLPPQRCPLWTSEKSTAAQSCLPLALQACIIQGLKEENHMLRLLLAENACVPQTQMLSQLQTQGGVSQAMLAASAGMPASAGLNHEAALQVRHKVT